MTRINEEAPYGMLEILRGSGDFYSWSSPSVWPERSSAAALLKRVDRRATFKDSSLKIIIMTSFCARCCIKVEISS